MPLTALLAGVATHLSVRPFEIDRYTFSIISAGLISFVSLFAILHHYDGYTISESLSKSIVITMQFIAGFFASTFIYRAFFHSLHRFPGPFPAKVTRFYAFKIAITTLQTHISSEKAHEKYGDFVRVGMRTPSDREPRPGADERRRPA